MQRISVDLPVPDGPMIAVTPVGAIVRLTSMSTGTPRRYSLRSRRISSAGCAGGAAGATAISSFLLACGFLSCRFLLIRRAVERGARLFRDLANHCPILLVGDWEEPVRAAECLLHFG